MNSLGKILKGFEKQVKENCISVDVIEKERKKLEKERNQIVKNKSDRVYENYVKDETLKRINLKIDTIKEILSKRG